MFLSINKFIFGVYNVFITCSSFKNSSTFFSIASILFFVKIFVFNSSRSISSDVFFILLKLYQFLTWLE
jgi:hypothetical protein